MAQRQQRQLQVMVATPAGATGQGGIARQMQALRLALAGRDDVAVRFAVTRGEGSILLSPFHLTGAMLAMIAARARGRLGVIHLNVASHGSTWRKLVLAALARLMGVPYVIHLHGGNYPIFWSDAHRTRSALIGWFFRHAAAVVVLGEVWRRFVLGKVPELGERVVVLPNAAPVPTLAHGGGGNLVHILFLGRINAPKGVLELGAALHAMADLTGWRATIAGDGYVEDARRQIAEWGLSDRIAVPGWVDTDGVAELIAGADILVLPSHEENLPVSIIEAMASGLAVVATPVGSVPDIVLDETTGLLVPVKDAAALEQALRRLVGDGALRRRLGAAGLALHRERLEINFYAAAMVELWRRAADR
jgi:glycosyltransferase involved in cell wall biosynthesis